MQSTGIAVPQLKFAIEFLQRPSLEIMWSDGLSRKKLMYYLLECTRKGDKQFVGARSQKGLHRRPVCDKLTLGTN